jgi:sugar lactone lactonase YvrE
MKKVRSEEIGRGEIAFRIPGGDLLTESIVYDAAHQRFLVSCDRARKIIAIDRHGKIRDFVPAADHGLWGGNGLGIDARRGLLWVDSTANEVGEGYDASHEAEAALYAFRLSDGAFVARYEAPQDGSRHFFDDLTVASDGTVYVSDSSGMMFRLQADAKALEPFVARGSMRSPQGSAIGAGGRVLYVADYAGAIHAVDRTTGDVARVVLPADFPPSGIDGLAFHGGWLIGVQNGIEPNRVVALHLAPGGLAVDAWKILEMNHPLIDEPTIGVVAKGAYYWLGASQRTKLEAKPPKTAEIHDAVVYRTTLP